MALLQLRRSRAAAIVAIATVTLLAQVAWASTTAKTNPSSAPSLHNLSLEQLDAELQVRRPLPLAINKQPKLTILPPQNQSCPIVHSLSTAKATAYALQPASLTTRLFTVLFPSSHPGINALLATLYISGPPNFLLALCPTDIDPASLSVMVAFAVGGLLGDTLFHLLPEIFLGEDEPERARLVLVEPNRNLLLGVAILVGFLVFVAMDKGLRIATGGVGHEHAHGHAHGEVVEGRSSGVEEKEGARLRKGKKAEGQGAKDVVVVEKEVNPSVKLGGLLNMM